jgi:hypothetical protein
MLVMKQLKPARLKDGDLRLMFLNRMRSVGRDVTRDFQATCKTWTHSVKFETLVSLTGPGPVLLVDTNDAIYAYVSRGTRAHVILPRGAKMLRFQSGYKAKTAPNVLSSGAGGKFGPVVYSAGVFHPGTQARNFDVLIEKKWERKFRDEMEDCLRQWARQSGNPIG